MTTLPLAAACDDRRAEIVALLDGELAADVADDVRAHITGCAVCGAFYSETSDLLQVTRAAFPIPAAPDLAHRIVDALPISQPPTNADPLLAELGSVRAEMQAMRTEMTEMRKLLAALRGQIAELPTRPSIRPIFPYAAPMDRLRSDR